MRTHYTKLKTKVLWRKLRIILIIMLLSGAGILLLQRSREDTPPVYASINQIYPYNSSSGNVNLYGESYTTCDGGRTACFDSPMWKTTNMLETETDGVATYKQSGAGWWGGKTAGSCCQSDDWHALRDNTGNHPGTQSKWASQTIKIPADINKITRVKFYDGGAGNMKLELIDSGGATLNQTTQSSADFNSLNWAVNPATTYKLKLSRLNNGNLILPITSPCSSCIYYIQWGSSIVTKGADSRTPHSATDAYPDGGAESESAYFGAISARGTANIARMAVWGETVPVPAAPTGLAAACPVPGTTATLSWDSTSATTQYRLRVNNTVNGWNDNCASSNSGDFCRNVTGTSASFTSVAGNVYSWWLHACNISGCSTPVSGTNFTCTAPTAPTINSLDVKQRAGATAGISNGRYGISGRQSTDAGGSGWLNPITIKANVNQGTGTATEEYFVAFYDGEGFIQSTFLNSITSRVTDPIHGFYLRVVKNISAGTYIHYVWNPNKAGGANWESIEGYTDTNPFRLRSPGNVIYYKIAPVSGSPAWNVIFEKELGNKTFNTDVYVRGDNNDAISNFAGNTTPLNQ